MPWHVRNSHFIFVVMAKKLLRLFWECFKIALLIVGGGYAIIAVVDEVFAKKLKWTDEGEVIAQLPLFQMVPGILAGHAAVYVGRKVAGWRGSAVALAGMALPSILIFTCVSMGYNQIPLESPHLIAVFAGLRAALTGVIAAMLVRGWRKGVVGVRGYCDFVLATVALLAGVHALIVIGVAIVAALVQAALPPPQKTLKLLTSPFAALIFLQYGLIALGGGYVLVPLYLHDFVGPEATYLQLPAEEFANVIALTQMTPGPIGINAATFFGYRLWGLGGALVSSFCLLLPGYLILSGALVSLARFRENRFVQAVLAGVKPVTLAMMAVALLSFAQMSFWAGEVAWATLQPVSVGLTVLVAGAMLMTKVGVVRLIFLSAFASWVVSLIF